MKKSTLVCILVAFIMSIAFTPPAFADLARYVQTEDKAYHWEKRYQVDLRDGAVLYELKLTSQAWQGIPWRHILRIVTPPKIGKTPTLALLIIAGPDREKELREGELIANAIGAPVAILYDIPNQPLFGGLEEDDLLAHTLVQYMETNDPTWPLLLPMVKGAVRAMDAVQEFMQQVLSTPVSGFVVGGASKRGWTTWLTPLVDKRVQAIIPMVYDNLNLSKQMQHQLETWGQFSEQISEYTGRSLPQRLLSNEKGTEVLSNLIDPFTYRKQITVPKLIIIGTNDKYWPLDALNIYYDELSGEKYILYVPDAGHDLEAGIDRVLKDISAFFLKTAGRLQFPKLIWEFREAEDTITVTITSESTPQAVRMWRATAQTKDFRDATWEAFVMRPESPNYTYTLKKPAEGYLAIFGEVVYNEEGRQFFLSTNVRIVP